MKYFITLLFALTSINALSLQENWEPEKKLSYVYLTWAKEDTSSHITVNYHSKVNADIAQVFYSTKPNNGNVNKYEFKSIGTTQSIANLQRAIHRVNLENLLPNTTYYFVVGDFISGFSKEYKFKTLPNDDSPVKFITGGDMGHSSDVEEMLYLAADRDPDFVAIGGDIAYADGKIKKFNRWDKWLSMYTKAMVTSDGRLIPMALALGNHEVNFFATNERTKAPFYFGLFEQGLKQNTYFKKNIGSHSILYFLDSGFINFFGGSQKKWLKKQMQTNQDIINQFAIYHIPLYPSHRKYKGTQSKLARNNWLDIFDDYKLDLAFENHDHTFKVTHPLKNGEIDQDGTTYLGDGCWGKSTRKAHPERWYLEESSSTAHFWEVTASEEGFKYRAIDDYGNQIYSHAKSN